MTRPGRLRAAAAPALAILASVAFTSAPARAAPGTRAGPAPGRPGAMSLEELRREPITVELDVPYADDGNPRHRLDVYLPKVRAPGKLPVIAFFHGGGWVEGDKAGGAARLLPLVRSGRYAGVSVGYRLSGEARWPAQLHDAKAAIRWIKANAARYGLDPDRVGAFGRSAGGHLAVMLGVAGDVPALEGGVGPRAPGASRVAAVVNFFGVTDLPALVGQPSDIDRRRPDAFEALLIGGALPEHPEKARAASPVTYVSPGDPPVLTVHGTRDRTVPYDQALRLDAALRSAGVPSFLVTVTGGDHGDFGTAADGRVEAFFARALRGEDAEVSTAPIDFPGR